MKNHKMLLGQHHFDWRRDGNRNSSAGSDTEESKVNTAAQHCLLLDAALTAAGLDWARTSPLSVAGAPLTPASLVGCFGVTQFPVRLFLHGLNKSW